MQLAAALAHQMAVGHGVFIVAVGLTGDRQSTDLLIGSQLVEIAVHRTHGDIGHPLPGAEENLFSRQVIVYVG